MQVAAATGHPILAAQTPITTPQQLAAVQIPQQMLPQSHQPYQVIILLSFYIIYLCFMELKRKKTIRIVCGRINVTNIGYMSRARKKCIYKRAISMM